MCSNGQLAFPLRMLAYKAKQTLQQMIAHFNFESKLKFKKKYIA
jgi:hypothetical protein